MKYYDFNANDILHMSVEDSSREVQSDRHTNEEGRLSQAELIEWSRRQRSLVPKTSPTKLGLRPRMVRGIRSPYHEKGRV